MNDLKKEIIKKSNLICFGDSVTKGFNGSVDIEGNWPYYLSHLLPFRQVVNAGMDAGTISGNTELDLTFQVQKFDLVNFNFATIFYGTNDFAHRPETLEIVGRLLVRNINTIFTKNPKIKIFGILPLNRFDYQRDNYEVSGYAGYQFKELLEKLTTIYQDFGIPVLNWRKKAPDLLTEENYTDRLADRRLHPNSATYRKMAEVIASFILANLTPLENS